MKRIILVCIMLFLFVGNAVAKVDLVTLPNRDQVQLTIYNSADLTLAKEKRYLTLKQGLNALQFSWANTLIDPTSLDMTPKELSDQITIKQLTYPARTKNVGLWHIDSQMTGNIPVEISYLTSGLSWRAFYLGTLSKDEKRLNLEGYVRVSNHSGEDYANAQVRLIVGKIHTVDEIAQLARQQFPFGRPEGGRELAEYQLRAEKNVMRMKSSMSFAPEAMAMDAVIEKEIIKEGLSEYFLYTIEGQETIADGWSKRLPSFNQAEIPVVNVYKYDEERYGFGVNRFLKFSNDKDHKMGETPIPGGIAKIFRTVTDNGLLSYEGQSSFQYIPVDEKAELNLGVVENVTIEPKLMALKTANFVYDKNRNISGWDEIRDYRIEIINSRSMDIKTEIRQHFPTNDWKIKNKANEGKYDKIDANTIEYKVDLSAESAKTIEYTVTIYYGERAE